MPANPWSTCFLCRSRQVDEFNSPDDSKTVKPSSELLIKYLIIGYIKGPKNQSIDLPQLISKVTVNQCPVWKVNLCCRCDEVAQIVQNLKVKIETLQRNLINVIQTVKKTVILGSELDVVEEKDDNVSHEYFQALRNFQNLINCNIDKEPSLLKFVSLASDEKQSAHNVEIKEELFDESNDDFHDSETILYEPMQIEDKPDYRSVSSQQEPVYMTEKIPPPPPVYKNRKRPSTQKQVSKSKRKVANTLDDDYDRGKKQQLKASSSNAICSRKNPNQTTLETAKSEMKQKLSEIQTAQAPLLDEYPSSDSESEVSDTDYAPDKHDIKKFTTSVGGWQPNLKLGTEVPTRSTRATRASGRSLDEPTTIDIKPFKPPAAPKISKPVTPLEDLTPAQKLAKMHRKTFTKLRLGKSKLSTCKLCYGRFKSYSFEHHLRSHETSEKKYTCPDCQIGFTTRQMFNVHLTAHYGWKQPCDICSESFYRLDLTKHLLETHPGNFYQCPYCCSAFGKFQSLAVHMKHHPNVELRCDLCQTPGDGLVYGRVRLLQHLHEIHLLTDFLIACEEPNCSETFYDQLAKSSHMNKHLEKYKCEFCAKCFKAQGALDRHVLIHTGENPVQCDECSERFKDRQILQLHKIDHHGLSKFKCEHCNKEFRIHNKLARHIKIAHGIRRPDEGFNCPTCDKWYLTKSNLNKHMESHLDKTKDFACEICGFLTTSKSLLWKHKLSHSEVKKHACSYCPKRFTQAAYLKDHLRTHTKEKPFQCELCGAAYNQPGALHMHVKAKHPELLKTKLSSENANINVESDLAYGQCSS